MQTDSYKFHKGYVQRYSQGDIDVLMFKQERNYVVLTNITGMPKGIFNSLAMARSQYKFLIRSLKHGHI